MIKKLEKGCGYDFDDGTYCSKEDELCEICKGKIEVLRKVGDVINELKKQSGLCSSKTCIDEKQLRKELGLEQTQTQEGENK